MALPDATLARLAQKWRGTVKGSVAAELIEARVVLRAVVTLDPRVAALLPPEPRGKAPRKEGPP